MYVIQANTIIINSASNMHRKNMNKNKTNMLTGNLMHTIITSITCVL